MSQPETTEDTEEIEDVPELELSDPDDYHRQQRLKEIHKARQEVHTTITSYDMPTGSTSAKKNNKQTMQRRDLAFAVAMYVSELEPLIFETDADVSLPDNYPWDTIIQFADALGHIPADIDSNLSFSPKANSIFVYRRCNQILADVKPLIIEDESNEWGIET